MTTPTTDRPGFDELGLSDPVLKAVQKIGYDTPSPIQAATIPHVLAGSDLIGQAQTGTGKTAAFALPILSNIDLKNARPQALILTPTRELAIQVAEAFQNYAANLKGFHVLPIYGGQPYEGQLRRLHRGVHVIVGTPGRVMDHLKRKTLDLEMLKCLVLDEADEMLRMGFIEDVEWILEQTPEGRQVALFSATMPRQVARIAQRHLEDPAVVELETKSTVTDNIKQRYIPLHWPQKVDALTRILEASSEDDATIVFVRTRKDTAELTLKLEARGYASAPLSGDIPQAQRERTINRFKKGEIDVVVATDVAARGLDVERIGHVINFDMPGDLEAYVHRVGRTGRAGRHGIATLFVTPREQRWLRSIEQATGQRLEKMSMPSATDINAARIERFKQRITDTLGGDGLDLARQTLTDYIQDNEDTDPLEIATALARIVLGETPLIDENEHAPTQRPTKNFTSGPPTSGNMVPYRIAVGRVHNVRTGNIVGAITNEIGISNDEIGRISIEHDFTIVHLPSDLPEAKIAHLRNVWVSGKQLHITPANGGGPPSRNPGPRSGGPSNPYNKPRKPYSPTPRKPRHETSYGDAERDKPSKPGFKPMSKTGKPKKFKKTDKPSNAETSDKKAEKREPKAKLKHPMAMPTKADRKNKDKDKFNVTKPKRKAKNPDKNKGKPKSKAEKAGEAAKKTKGVSKSKPRPKAKSEKADDGKFTKRTDKYASPIAPKSKFRKKKKRSHPSQ